MSIDRPTAPRRFADLSATQRRAFFGAWFGYLLDGFDFVLITLVLTEVSKDFGLDLTTAATLVSAAFVSRWLGGLALGALGDRFGRKPAMITSILLFALGSLLCGLSWGYWSLFAFRAIVGLGMAGEYGSSTTFVMESWPKALRNRASGWLLSAYPIGSILAARAYAVIVPHSSWRWLFIVGLVPAAIALVLRRTLPEAEEWTRDRHAHRETVPSSSASVLLHGPRAALNAVLAIVIAASLVLVFSGHAGPYYPILIIVVIAGFVIYARQLARAEWLMAVGLIVVVFAAFLTSWPVQSLLPTYLKTTLHYDAGEVANALTWAGLGYAAGSILAGSLGDRFGTRTTYAIGLLLSAVLVFPVFAIGGGNEVLVWVLLFLLQATGQGISGLLPKFVGDHFPVRTRAAGLGFTYNVGALGGAVAPLAGARIAVHLGLGESLSLLACTLALVTALLVAFDVPRLLARLTGSHPPRVLDGPSGAPPLGRVDDRADTGRPA